MVVFIAGVLGVICGALIVTVGVALRLSYEERRLIKQRELEHLVKEVETLNLLNKKIREILQKREFFVDKSVRFLSVDDCYISLDDFVYLESFSSQNNFYLPTYLIEEFFKNIAHRKVILHSHEVLAMGGSTYKGGRRVLEAFSDELMMLIDDRKKQIKRTSRQPLHYLTKD